MATENIVLFPFMGQGHMRPFLALAQQIEARNGYVVTLINTPLNINKLRSLLRPNSSIRLLEIPFRSSDHGLPPNSENTDALPFPFILHLLQTSHSLKPAFRSLISDIVRGEGRLPLCIIADLFFPWTAEVANEFGVFHAIFYTGGGYGMAVFHSLWSNFPSMRLSSTAPDYPIPEFPKSYRIQLNRIPEHLRTAECSDSWTLFIQQVFRGWLDSDGHLFNTVEEFDPIGLMYFRQQLNRSVWPVGPVLSIESKARASGKEIGIEWNICEKWLDSKPPNSVLYIAFGSQVTISASQMMQLAMALEASGKDFIWVIKPPSEADELSKSNVGEWLPTGFEIRVQSLNQGLLVHSWAPQLQILSHKSVSVFLSHCGWNSVLEALSNGVPLIAWPMMAEQHFNAKMLEEELGVCIWVAEGSVREVRRDDIMEKIEMVMSGTEGKEMVRRAREVRDTMKNAMKEEKGFRGSSVKAMDEFLQAALVKREKK